MAYKVKEFNVIVQNVTGAGAAVFGALAAAKINLKAVCGWTSDKDGNAVLQFLVDPGQEAEARAALTQAKFKVKTTDVIAVDVRNKVGAMAEVTGKLAAANVDIDYAYAAAATKKSALLVLRVSSPAKAVKALES